MKLILASHNENKLKELKYLMQDTDYEILSIADFNLSEPVEDGKTFEENAFIKAKYSIEQTSILSLSDDSGFEVEAIESQPSIYSARWSVNGKYDKAFETINTLLDRVNKEKQALGLPLNNKAKFVCVLCLYNPVSKDKTPYSFFRGEAEGSFIYPPRGENGFAYDSVFIPQGYSKTFAEMSVAEKNNLSHRAKALKKLKTFLTTTYNING